MLIGTPTKQQSGARLDNEDGSFHFEPALGNTGGQLKLDFSTWREEMASDDL